MDKDKVIEYLMEENRYFRDRYENEKGALIDSMNAEHDAIVYELKAEIERLTKYVEIAKHRKNRSTIRKKVLARDNDECVECGSEKFLQVDHIIPLDAGGADTVENCQTLCIDCHIKKHEGEPVANLLKAQRKKLIGGQRA